MSNRIIIDLDDTICDSSDGYENAKPREEVISKLRHYKNHDFEIVIHTSRNMRTYSSNLGKINLHTLPIILDWLDKNEVPVDEVIIGKPWCGTGGFYVDDKAIRPDEFVNLSLEEIKALTSKKGV